MSAQQVLHWVPSSNILGAAMWKTRKWVLATVWVMEGESEGNLQVVPRFQSRSDSSLAQVQAQPLLQCCLPGSGYILGRQRQCQPPNPLSSSLFASWLDLPHEQHFLEIWSRFCVATVFSSWLPDLSGESAECTGRIWIQMIRLHGLQWWQIYAQRRRKVSKSLKMFLKVTANSLYENIIYESFEFSEFSLE